jgi:parallel beta-helix repeat protein
VWSYATGSLVLSSPAVVNGVVYLGSYDDSVYALNATTGALVWSYATGGAVISSPAVVNGVVYVGSDDGNVYALDAATGALVWSYATGSLVLSSPAVVNGVVYVGSDDGNVYALDAATGALVWSYATGGGVYSSPAVADGVVYVGSYDDSVYALNATTGALVWSYATGGGVYSSPAVADGVVYVGSYDGKVYAFGSLQTVYIDADGSIAPAGAPIETSDYITYIFTGDMSYTTYNGIVVERSNIVIDGNGHTVEGSQGGTGLSLTDMSNVTIENANIEGFANGISVTDSNDNLIGGNNVTANSNCGIYLLASSNNSISGNTATANNVGIWLQASSNNAVIGNDAAANNKSGIILQSSSNNMIYHNSFVGNVVQASVDSASVGNAWDNGYPSGGNYWSDYNGTDLKRGPYQNVTGSDGIGDTPCVIGANNTDNYPFMNPWSPHDVAVIDVVLCKTVVGLGYDVNVTVTAADLGDLPETFNVAVYASTFIASQNVTLAFVTSQKVALSSGNSLNITFVLNTAGYPYGNYTMIAYAEPVPGETNIANNCMSRGTVHVGIPGDINGDGTVDIFDAVLLAAAFNSVPGSSNWNPNADLNSDGIVNIFDAVILATYYGQTSPTE